MGTVAGMVLLTYSFYVVYCVLNWSLVIGRWSIVFSENTNTKIKDAGINERIKGQRMRVIKNVIAT